MGGNGSQAGIRKLYDRREAIDNRAIGEKK